MKINSILDLFVNGVNVIDVYSDKYSIPLTKITVNENNDLQFDSNGDIDDYQLVIIDKLFKCRRTLNFQPINDSTRDILIENNRIVVENVTNEGMYLHDEVPVVCELIGDTLITGISPQEEDVFKSITVIRSNLNDIDNLEISCMLTIDDFNLRIVAEVFCV